MKQIILMADIVKSRLQDQQTLMSEFRNLVSIINTKYKTSILSPLTITLGDEFQGVIKNAEMAAVIIIHLEEERIHRRSGFTLRYVLNQGEIETPINKKIAFEMLGEGLSGARKMLTLLKETDKRFFISLENKNHSELLNNGFVIFDMLVNKWSSKNEEELVSNLLKYTDYKKVAEIMGKDVSQIWKKQKSLQLESYYAIKNMINLSFKLPA